MQINSLTHFVRKLVMCEFCLKVDAQGLYGKGKSGVKLPFSLRSGTIRGCQGGLH